MLSFMVIYGSASLGQNFTQLGLIDEYQLLVHPIVLGSGINWPTGQAV
jgi:dihydrofolate reductase